MALIDLDDTASRQKLTILLLAVFIIMDIWLLGVGLDYKETCSDRCMEQIKAVASQCRVWNGTDPYGYMHSFNLSAVGGG